MLGLVLWRRLFLRISKKKLQLQLDNTKTIKYDGLQYK